MIICAIAFDMSKQYSWIIVAHPRREPERVLSEAPQWYKNKSEAIESLKRVARGVDIPDCWGGPYYFIVRRSAYVVKYDKLN
jgi:hypothetical protein